MSIRVNPGVFDPWSATSSLMLAESIRNESFDSAIDIGTGCGLQALVAAQSCRRVFATDISEVAIECALSNAVTTKLSDKIEFLTGDTYAHMDDSVDIIICNPPFFSDEPRTPHERAICDPDQQMLRTLLSGATQRLREGGCLLVAFSTIGPTGVLFDSLDESSLKPEIVNQTALAIGLFYVLKITPA